jgi:hypothetical protein
VEDAVSWFGSDQYDHYHISYCILRSLDLCIMRYALWTSCPCVPWWFQPKSYALRELCIITLCIMKKSTVPSNDGDHTSHQLIHPKECAITSNTIRRLSYATSSLMHGAPGCDWTSARLYVAGAQSPIHHLLGYLYQSMTSPGESPFQFFERYLFYVFETSIRYPGGFLGAYEL